MEWWTGLLSIQFCKVVVLSYETKHALNEQLIISLKVRAHGSRNQRLDVGVAYLPIISWPAHKMFAFYLVNLGSFPIKKWFHWGNIQQLHRLEIEIATYHFDLLRYWPIRYKGWWLCWQERLPLIIKGKLGCHHTMGTVKRMRFSFKVPPNIYTSSSKI